MSEPIRPHPVGGVDYPRTFQELQAWLPDDQACLNYLARLRWPDGFVCPSCLSTRAWQTSKARWMCAACARQTSVTAGTIFHRIRDAVVDVVRGDLVPHFAKERDVRAGPA